MRILYLAHDLDDSAIWRRAAMLRAGGASVQAAGFRRREGPLPEPAILLGQTADARMLQRAASVARALAGLRHSLAEVQAPDVIIARNLEMLALAVRAKSFWPEALLVYEVLDIHRMMLGDGPRPRAMRALERRLMRRVGLVLTSSPGFVNEYFQPHGQTRVPIRIVENKCFYPEAALPAVPKLRPVAAPITIGWFGILRCAWSLDCLDRVTRAAPGRYRVLLRGKPALDQLPQFHATVAANPDLDFGGPYRNPDDLADIYGQVHLSWLIDRYDAGKNSDWLLPNRLYEGCRHHAVPVALAGTEVANFLGDYGLGLTIAAPDAEEVGRRLGALSLAEVEAMRTAVAEVATQVWTTGPEECQELTGLMAQIAAARGRRRQAAMRRKGWFTT
ncbi:glycosyl transferase [Cereibacter sphaeroides]|uniref:glycosyltransferase n=1 Tax=Cereibacter sphaeroides TaxID=1063 RepID=UPI000F520AA9|nr:glycosyltransferase [Cereibacter sphaeroides]AZB55644.1 glycosyl transferase [Cereibacter sphaeroides]AZB59904.1 glycosyl transferase [Cereibacter sphaeroides]